MRKNRSAKNIMSNVGKTHTHNKSGINPLGLCGSYFFVNFIKISVFRNQFFLSKNNKNA